MGSTRLPGKVLLPIEGKAMLWHVVERTKQSGKVDTVVVATSKSHSDDPIEEFCKMNGITCFRGSEDDVLDRFYGAVKKFNPRAVVRVTADCPLIDPDVIDKAIKEFENTECDYVSNTNRYTYPDGLDVEVFSFNALEKALGFHFPAFLSNQKPPLYRRYRDWETDRKSVV